MSALAKGHRDARGADAGSADDGDIASHGARKSAAERQAQPCAAALRGRRSGVSNAAAHPDPRVCTLRRAFSGAARSKGLKMRSHSSAVSPAPPSDTSTRSTITAASVACGCAGSMSTVTDTAEPAENLMAL